MNTKEICTAGNFRPSLTLAIFVQRLMSNLKKIEKIQRQKLLHHTVKVQGFYIRPMEQIALVCVLVNCMPLEKIGDFGSTGSLVCFISEKHSQSYLDFTLQLLTIMAHTVYEHRSCVHAQMQFIIAVFDRISTISTLAQRANLRWGEKGSSAERKKFNGRTFAGIQQLIDIN